MVMGQKQELRQSQSLVMTPQLQQAIKLLQLSNLEIQEFVGQEIERNPLLELADPSRPERGDGKKEDSHKNENIDELDTSTVYAKENLPDKNEEPLDVNYNDYYDDHIPTSGSSTNSTSYSTPSTNSFQIDDENNYIENTIETSETLADHLLEQLNADIPDPIERLIGFHLIHMLDSAGYFCGDIESISSQIGCSEKQVDLVLGKLKKFDPAGVFAKDLRECLAIQLKEKDRLDPIMEKLLDNLEHLAKQDKKLLLKCCNVNEEDLIDMIAEVRSLNPKPGELYNNDIAQTVVPDVFLRSALGGKWVIEINNETLPKILVNRQYLSLVTKDASSEKDKIYINEQLNSANWLVKSLEQRAQTILKVATEIVRQQDSFFTNGIRYLKPLTLKDIAEKIEMHESTVSRVTANKYISTSRGVFQMKYFFTSAITSSSGEKSLSAESVRDRIKELIDKETKEDILSDDKIVEILRDSKITIARRTVAKYRESMNIPSSVTRRRQKISPSLNII